jgi:hypothetical protein
MDCEAVFVNEIIPITVSLQQAYVHFLSARTATGDLSKREGNDSDFEQLKCNAKVQVRQSALISRWVEKRDRVAPGLGQRGK